MSDDNPPADFHCHVDLFPDPAAVIRDCDKVGIRTLAVTTTPKAWPGNRRLAEHSSHVRVALGLHPQLVADRAHEIKLFEEYLSTARFVGEVGLDAGPHYFRSLPQQEAVLSRVLSLCAEQGDKILTVHSTRAVRRVLDLIEARLPPRQGRVVLHWFTGSVAEARRAVELGCYFSVNQAMVNSARAQALVAGLPVDRLLTETDGPFVEHRGAPARPTDVPEIVAGLAKIRGLALAEMARVLTMNVRRLLSLADTPDTRIGTGARSTSFTS